jgi:hypothetical protein
MLFRLAGGAGEIDLSRPPAFAPAGPDANVAQRGRTGGRIGDIGVTILEKARYVHCDDNGRIDRVFGFSDVLHKDGENWELDQPYVDIVDANFLCRITGDRGLLRIVNTGGGAEPADGKLLGNVVLHVMPRNKGRVKEAFLYLDDIAFVSERTHFSTAGPVRFVSREVRIVGTGLEGAYNALHGRLEYLRITNLHSLRIKSSQVGLFAAQEPASDKPSGAQASPKPAGASAPTTTAKQAQPTPESRLVPITPPPARHYQCLFADNVIIDAPEQLVIAEDEITVVNILLDEPADQNSQTTAPATDANAAPPPPSQSPTAGPPTEVAAPSPPTEPAAAEPNQHPFPPDEDYDIVVTCENGILAVPMDSLRSLNDFAQSSNSPTGAERPGRAGRTLLAARKIDYDAAAGSAVAAGPVELTFDVNAGTGERDRQEGRQVPARFESGHLRRRHRLYHDPPGPQRRPTRYDFLADPDGRFVGSGRRKLCRYGRRCPAHHRRA